MHGFGSRLRFNPTDSEVRSLPASLPNWPPFPDTIAALRRLKVHYLLAVISNVDADLFADSTTPRGTVRLRSHRPGRPRLQAVAFDIQTGSDNAPLWTPANGYTLAKASITM